MHAQLHALSPDAVLSFVVCAGRTIWCPLVMSNAPHSLPWPLAKAVAEGATEKRSRRQRVFMAVKSVGRQWEWSCYVGWLCDA